MRAGSWLYVAGLAALSALLVGSLWVVPYLPTNDGPEWIYATHVENHFSDPGAPYASYYTPALQFASRGLSVVYGPFEAWLGWQRGLQVALSLIALAAAWGFVVLVRALRPERRAIAFLGFPLAMSWSFYMGFWSFVIAGTLGYFVLALALRFRHPSWKERSLLAVLLLLVSIAHVFGAVLTGGALLGLGLARAEPGRRLRELGGVVLTGLPAAGILTACVAVSKNLTEAAMARDAARLPWLNAIEAFPRTVAPGPLWRALSMLALVFGALVVAICRARRVSTPADDRGLSVAGAALLVLGMVAPFQVPGWQAFSERFVPLGVALLLACLPVEALRESLRRWASPVVFGLSALYVGATYPFHQRLATLCPDAIAGLEAALHFDGFVLPIQLAATELPFYNRTIAEVPLLDPLLHMGNLYATAHGGIPLRSFTGNVAVHPFVERTDVSRPPEPDFLHYTDALNSYEYHHDPSIRHRVDDQLAGIGTVYPNVLVVGARPDDIEVWKARGYVPEWEARTAFVGHFEPCTLDVRMAVDMASPAPVFDVYAGEIGHLHGVTVPAGVEPDGFAHFRLTPAPCGVVRVKATWEGGGRRCSNADAAGELLVKVTRTKGSARCEGP
jgi:hypothetical protein